MDPSFKLEAEAEIFRYRRHPTAYDWILLFVASGLLITNQRAVWMNAERSFSFPDLLPMAILGLAIAAFIRKRTLEVGHDSLSHETRWGRKEVIRFCRVGEMIESGFDLCIVHPVKNGWIRLCLLKGDFKADEWPEIVILLAGRIRTGAPTAQISLLKCD